MRFSPVNFVIAAAIHPREELAYRNTRNDFGVRAGQVVVVDIHKRALDNTGPSSKLSGQCLNHQSERVTFNASILLNFRELFSKYAELCEIITFTGM